MRKLLVLGLLLASAAQAQPPVYYSPLSGTGSGFNFAGGTLSGANQYRNAAGLLAGDDNIIDDGLGGMSMLGLTVSGTASIRDITMPGSGVRSINAPSAAVSLQTGGVQRLNLRSGGVSVGYTSTAYTAGADLDVNGVISGTTVKPICRASTPCTAGNLGEVCSSPSKLIVAVCNGNGSWAPQTSNTLVSMTALQ